MHSLKQITIDFDLYEKELSDERHENYISGKECAIDTVCGYVFGEVELSNHFIEGVSKKTLDNLERLKSSYYQLVKLVIESKQENEQANNG